jgi:hypothetical protein
MGIFADLLSGKKIVYADCWTPDGGFGKLIRVNSRDLTVTPRDKVGTRTLPVLRVIGIRDSWVRPERPAKIKMRKPTVIAVVHHPVYGRGHITGESERGQSVQVKFERCPSSLSLFFFQSKAITINQRTFLRKLGSVQESDEAHDFSGFISSS